MAEVANASTTLYIPRQFDPSEMGTVGVAFMNPTLTTASLTYRLRSDQGTTLMTANGTIPAKGQSALTLDQIFPGASAAGSFSAEIDVDQVTGFWMYGDFVTSTDGARLLSSNDAISTPAFTNLTSTSEISFVNLGSGTLTGNLVLVNASGASVVSVPFQAPPLGLIQRTVVSMFPSQAAGLNSNGYWIGFNSVATGSKIIGTVVTTNAGLDNVVANAVSASYTQGLFPHVVGGQLGGAIYESLLTLTNYRSTANVTLTLRQTSGAVLTVQRTILQSGVLRTSINSLFGVPSVDGWLQVDGGTGSLSGFVTYTDTVSGGSTAVEMQSSSGGDTGLIFGHVANVSPWWTGIALANASTSIAQVEVYAFDRSGTLIAGPAQSAGAAFAIPAQSKKAFLIDEVLPPMQTRQTDGGYLYIRTTNAVQISGIELFFLRSSRVYSNVPATRLTGLGLAFTPPSTPAAGTGGTIVMEQAFIGDANRQPITSLQPCASVTLNVVVNNTTGGTVIVTRQYRAIGPNGYSLYMGSFARDQAAGRTSAYSSVTVPCDAPAGTYTFTATVDYNGILSSNSITVQSSGGTGGGGGSGGGTGGGGTGSCTPSETTICVLANDYDTVPMMSSAGACYDTFTKTGNMSAINLLAQGGSPISRYTWSVATGSTLPAGTALEPLTGIFKRIGTTVGAGTFTIQASDGTRIGTRTFTLTVQNVDSDVFSPNFSGPCPVAAFQQPQSQTITLPDAPQAKAYGASLQAILGTPGTLTWRVSNGTLPGGLVVDQSSGVLRGTPFSSASGGTYRFQVSITTSNPSPGGTPTALCSSFGCPTYVITVP